MPTISIKADLKPLQRAFVDLGSKQVPFATSLALNALANGVRADEKNDIVETFDHATPFTVNAFVIKPATKALAVATVFAKDIQAAYLLPYIDGGERSLGGKRAMLVPRSVGVNAYGNLPKNKLASLKGKPNVFIGPVHFRRSGKTVSGVWERPPVAKAGSRAAPPPATGLTLLIQFEDTTPAPKHFDFYVRAATYVHGHAAAAFDTALQKAFATARK